MILTNIIYVFGDYDKYNYLFFVFSTNNKILYTCVMGVSERFPVSLNAVNIVCFKIDWKERALNVLLLKRSISPQKNKWSLPGGFVNENESIEEAAPVSYTHLTLPTIVGV